MSRTARASSAIRRLAAALLLAAAASVLAGQAAPAMAVDHGHGHAKLAGVVRPADEICVSCEGTGGSAP
jgi:hypothetical protein